MNDEIIEIKRTLIKGMVDYMRYGGAEDESDPDYDPEFDAGYTQEDVDRCGEILDAYLSSLAKTPTNGRNEFIMEAVKVAVLDLNKLNDRCDESLIETDQREQLCELIIAAAQQAGLTSSEYDITEEWREW